MMRMSSVKGFIRSWRQQTGMQIATLSVLAGTFTVITIFWLVQRNLERVMTHWGEAVRVSVFLKDQVDSEQINATKKFLDELGQFKAVEFLSKEEAGRRFQAQMGSYSPHFLGDPEFGNPLPMSFEASLRDNIPAASRYAILKELADKITTQPSVEDVYFGQGWVENYATAMKTFEYSSWFLMLILLAGSLFVVGNSIRNAIAQRRDEIEILELVGATPEMIKRPYLVEGVLMGVSASGLAILFSFALFTWQAQMIRSDLGFLNLAQAISFLTVTDVLGLLFLGGAFGALGAFLCVRRICNGWSAAQFEEAKW